MRISVLITNFNYAAYIGAAVQSAVCQNLPACEIVIVDDGSTDGSQAIIEQLAKRYWNVIPVFQRNAGQAAAINAGFKNCSGDVICMLDADDLWDATHNKRIVSIFENDPTVAMVANRYRIIDTDGNVILNLAGPVAYNGAWDQLIVKTGAPWLLGATSALSFNRSALEKVLPIPASQWRLCADGALAYASVFLGKTVILPDALGSYRVHGTNNHVNVSRDPQITQSDVEMTNQYINDFLARIGRDERVNLMNNLHYRRDKFYRHGGRISEAAAIARLICTWPLYSTPEKIKYLARFSAKAVLPRSAGHRSRDGGDGRQKSVIEGR